MMAESVSSEVLSLEPLSHDLKLPWSVDNGQEQTYKKVLTKVAIPLLVFFLMVPWLPIIEKAYQRDDLKRVKTKLILTRMDVPEKQRPVVNAHPKPKAKEQAIAAKKTKKSQSIASESVENKGIGGFAKQLSALRGSLQVAKLSNKNVFESRNGKVKKSTQSVLGEKNALKSSGGIEVDNITIDKTGSTLAAHQFIAVDSPIQGVDLPGGREYEYGSDQQGKRDMESIRKVFEQYKGAVYGLYTKALRQYPDLNGKFLFQLVIEADGSITDLQLVISELGVRELEQKILAKINGIRFGAATVVATAVQYKFVFLPN